MLSREGTRFFTNHYSPFTAVPAGGTPIAQSRATRPRVRSVPDVESDLIVARVIGLLGRLRDKGLRAIASFASGCRPADCGQVNEELVTIERFRENVERESQFSGADVIEFLLDFGIGNAMAKEAAAKSADLRADELRKEADELKCPAEGALHAQAAVETSTPRASDPPRVGP